jgi:hypothetical protein
MKVEDLGYVEVSRLPKVIPKMVKVGGKKFSVDRAAYRLIWASIHATKRGREHALKKLGG